MHITYNNRTLFCPSAPQNRKFKRPAGVTDINVRNLVHFVREEMGWFVLATLGWPHQRSTRARLVVGGHLRRSSQQANHDRFIFVYVKTTTSESVVNLKNVWKWIGCTLSGFRLFERHLRCDETKWFLEKHSAYRLLGAMVILLQIITPCATHSCPEPTSDVTVLNSGNQCKSCCCVLGVQVGRLYRTQCSPCESCTRAYQDWRGKYQWWDRQPNGRSRMVARTKRTCRGATDIWTWINQ